MIEQANDRPEKPRRTCLALAPLGLLFLLAAIPSAGPAAEPATPPQPPRGPLPNLLVIVADDFSSLYLGSSGDPRRATPHLDTLAAQGIVFDRAYSNSPQCTPSRQSFITGLLPHAVGVTRLESRLPEGTLTLGSWLGEHGYRTAAIGKMHFNGPSHHGFGTLIDVPEWLDQLRRHPPAGGDLRRPWRPFVDPPAVWLNAACQDHGLPAAAMEASFFVDRAIEYISRASDRPYALVVSFYEPHAPFRFPREWKGRYEARQFPAPTLTPDDERDRPRVFQRLSDDDFRGVQAAFYTSLSFLDTQVGRLLRAVDETGRAHETLVVFLGDNGYLLGQHGRLEKNCFFEPAVRVPLIVRWPGRLPAGQKRRELVELVDLVPTVCRLLGAPIPPRRQGLDLTPLLEGRPGARGRESVFSEYPEAEEAMIRTDRYKLVVGSGRRRRQDHMESAQPPAGPTLRLYDLERDPGENTNLGADPKLESVRADLVDRLYDRMVDTWIGRVPIPIGLSTMETIYWCLRPRD